MDPNEETNTIVAILRLQPQICKQVEIVVQRLGELLFRFRCHFRRNENALMKIFNIAHRAENYKIF